jgi:hypothetical protein
MRKTLFFLVAFSLIAVTSASAKDMAKRFGLGFVTTDAPVGGRYWFSPKAGIDVGFGLTSTQELQGDDTKKTQTGWQARIGIPFVLIPAGDRVNFMFDPSFTYKDPGLENSDLKYYVIQGALEFEFFVSDDFSVGASHGINVEITSGIPENTGTGTTSTTDFNLFGNNVTQFGFHYYFPGSGN